jgi:hypothetical protein
MSLVNAGAQSTNKYLHPGTVIKIQWSGHRHRDINATPDQHAQIPKCTWQSNFGQEDKNHLMRKSNLFFFKCSEKWKSRNPYGRQRSGTLTLFEILFLKVRMQFFLSTKRRSMKREGMSSRRK